MNVFESCEYNLSWSVLQWEETWHKLSSAPASKSAVLSMFMVYLQKLITKLLYHNKENLERYEPNKNGRGDRAALT